MLSHRRIGGLVTRWPAHGGDTTDSRHESFDREVEKQKWGVAISRDLVLCPNHERAVTRRPRPDVMR